MSAFKVSDYSGEQDMKKITNYLYMLNEQLRYMFDNMDPEDNFSDSALTKYLRNGENIATLELTAEKLKIALSDANGNISILQQTASSLTSRISDAEGNISSLEQTASSLTSQIADAKGNISVLQQTASSLTSRIADAEGNISSLRQTATSLTSQISDVNGNVSKLQQTATSLTSRISSVEGDISSVQQTASSLTSRIQNAEGNISTVRQTANKIDWIISSGSSSSNFSLTSRMASLISEKIDIAGYVTFSALKSSGKTEINGANITTGTIDAKLLAIGGEKVFGMDNGVFKLYKKFASNSFNDIFVSGYIRTTNGPDIRGRNGKVSIGGKTYDGGTLSSSATLSSVILALNRLITYIDSVLD